MNKLSLSTARRRALLQLGLLAGVGVALIGPGNRDAEADGEGRCFEENECTFKKPNFMIVLDYSSSMNQPFGVGQTRWEVAVDAITELMTTNGGFFQENMNVALMRYGHDPNPDSPGTTIPSDVGGIVDGQSLDVFWYDPDAADLEYFSCNGAAIIDALADTPPPTCGTGPTCSGVGTWTKGALDFTAELIAQSKADHPEDTVPGDERFYGVMVVTDGAWTPAEGFPQLSPPEANPALTATQLFDDQGIPTYVVAVADAANLPFANELAAAGGTESAVGAENPTELFQAIGQVVQDIEDQVIVPECTAGLPRVMVLLDASSSMLNVGQFPGGPGETGWDRARAALADSGGGSLFDVEVEGIGLPVEDLIHLGLTVFGSDLPAEEKVLVQYGPCMQDNFAWALDPETSCDLPGCSDPWGGPNISWTFKDGSEVPPFFDQSTRSHMPACLPAPGLPLCQGSGTFTHRGLDLVFDNFMAYSANPPDLYPADENTQYANILITDGQYSGYSTDAQVQSALEAMFDAGVQTWVIGFGDGLESPAAQQQLNNMAGWGSGGVESYFDAETQSELEAALAAIIADIEFDPCCAFNDCSENPEPSTDEPDPGDDGFGDGGGDGGNDGGADGGNDGGNDGGGDGGNDGGNDGGGDGGNDGGGDGGNDGGNDGGGDGGNDGGGDGGNDGGGDGGWDSDGDGTSDGWDGDDDAGTGGDAGFGWGNDAGLNGRGCGCQAEPAGPAGGALGLLALGLLGFVNRRRRN